MGTERSADLLRRSADEPDAFGGFYDAHFEGVLRYLTRRTCDAEAGLDLTAESFAQAFLSRRRFRGTTDAEAAGWLYRIAKRQLAGYFKKGRSGREACERLGQYATVEALGFDDALARAQDLLGIRPPENAARWATFREIPGSRCERRQAKA